MKALLIGALVLIAAAVMPAPTVLAQPTVPTVATTHAVVHQEYNGPQVDFNGDCTVSIGDILLAVQERGYEYTVNKVVPEFGHFGPDYCWPPRSIKAEAPEQLEAARNACGWFEWAMAQPVQTYQAHPGGVRTFWIVGNTDARDYVLRSVSVYDFQSGWPQLQVSGTNALQQIRYWCQQI